MAGFYAPNSGWLPSWGLGIGLLEQSGNPSLVVPWFDFSCLFRVVVRLPFCPTLPILTPGLQLLGKVREEFFPPELYQPLLEFQNNMLPVATCLSLYLPLPGVTNTAHLLFIFVEVTGGST